MAIDREDREQVAQMSGAADIELKKNSAIFYDSEIICMVPMETEPRDETLFYCAGWSDFENMGISVVTVYDFVTCAYRVFLQDNLEKLRQLIESRSIIMGFNNKRFDDNLLAANGIEIPKSKSYDIWAQIVDTQSPGQRAGFSLNNMLKANGLEAKSGEGGNAPKLAQSGRWGELINYCLDDTRLSVQLLRLLCNDMMRHPKNGGYMQVAKPWEVVKSQPGEALFE